MARVPRLVRRCKRKSRVLVRPRVLRREEYEGLMPEARVELIRELVPLGLMLIQEELDREVVRLAGAVHSRGTSYNRYGTNPGSVKLMGQRVGIRVPRVRGAQGEVPLAGYGRFHEGTQLEEGLFRRVLYGISCRNYEAAAEAIPGAIGLSSSTVSRRFIEASAEKLKEFQERRLSEWDLTAVFLDGKTFAEDSLVLALGVAMDGRKVMLGFVQTETENEAVLKAFLGSLLDRGLTLRRGLLVVIDGSKGLYAGVRKALGKRAVVQRCQWHKRENVVAYLPKSEQALWRRRLQQAYGRPTYEEAKRELLRLHGELAGRNQSAARSLEEGLEETLTLHRLGVFPLLGRSFKTTNCLESVNAMAEGVCGKVDRWQTSDQKHRWFASALMDIEPRLRKVMGYHHLPKLREALMKELGLETEVKVTRRKIAA
jgi:putative transposase